MGLNILKLDRRTAIVNQGAEWVKGVLQKLGISVVELDYSEMVKAEGAWHCTYAAIEREN
jgi:N-dimethylarginine dimethylaminohydrolase